MLTITPREQVDAYYVSSALNQSTLKQLSKGLAYFISRQELEADSENNSFTIGSAVDCILTGNEEDFDNHFYVSRLEKKPSEAEIAIISLVYQVSEEDKSLSDYPEEIERACVQVGWQMNWKPETKVKKIIEVGTVYFEEMKASAEKTVLDATQYRLVLEIVNSLRESSVTKDYFDRGLYEKLEDFYMYLQYPIYFKQHGIDCKALLDMLIIEVDRENEILILSPIDIKTTRHSVVDFPVAVRSFRYDIQAAWYNEALFSLKEFFLTTFNCKHLIVNNFMFIVESTTQVGRPMVFQVTESLLKMGKYGQEEISANKMGIFSLDQTIDTSRRILSPELKGFEKLLEEYAFYMENGWETDYKLRNQKEGFPVSIDWKGILEN